MQKFKKYIIPVIILISTFVSSYTVFLTEKSTVMMSIANSIYASFDINNTMITLPILCKIFAALIIICTLVSVFVKKDIYKAACHIVVMLSNILFFVFLTSNFTAYISLIIFLPAVLSLVSIFILYKNHESTYKYIFMMFAIISIISVAVITIFMIAKGLPAIFKIGPFEFLFTTTWKPTAQTPQFGILSMVLTTIAATAGSVLIGAPIGVLTAVFIAEIAPKKIATVLKSGVELLAGIPSVIYGFFGMMVIVPFIRDLFKIKVGDSLLAVIIILTIMILPTVISISENAIRAVPKEYKEASLGLGATHIYTIFKVILPAAKSGTIAAVILGVGRSIGETMAIIMVAGNVPNLPNLLTPVLPMTAGIVKEMAYSQGLHREALFAIGLILFIFIMTINVVFRKIVERAGLKNES